MNSVYKWEGAIGKPDTVVSGGIPFNRMVYVSLKRLEVTQVIKTISAFMELGDLLPYS
jgi:hypothetical protein